MNRVPVVGRFAPSPTGDLHFGSLVSAVGSFLEARTAGGQWLLRIEDIDPPREVAGSAERIIGDLQRLGMRPDGPVLYQSTRLEAYQYALDVLMEKNLAYPCSCSRKDLPSSGIYPGTCRNGIAKGKHARSIRFRVEDNKYAFNDKLQGLITDSTASIAGDFVIRRADGLFAYQLAVVVDDAYQGVNQVVRGADLLDSTGRQLCLQRAIGITTPEYLHLPLVLSMNGKKLSKQTQADPVKNQEPAKAIESALRFLGQNPPVDVSLDDIWEWAMEHWNRKFIPRRTSI